MKEINSKIIKNIIAPFIVLNIIIVFSILIMFLMTITNVMPKKYYKASDFNIRILYSKVDYDNDNIDDYSDIILGAREQINNKYDNIETFLYLSLKRAGYDLEKMIFEDIELYPNDYVNNSLKNINIYLKKYYPSFTNDYNEIANWQPGDIIIFENDNIGIVSDRRNKEGITLIINYNNKVVEEDSIKKYPIKGHYRFDTLYERS